jgi:hypothetical protein
MLAALMLTACSPSDLTGAVDNSVPALVKLQQKNVLEYVSASSRLSAVPSTESWQLDTKRQSNGEYRFYSGSWLMIILPARVEGGNQQVVLIETVKDTSWCGFIKPDGGIVESCFKR